MSELEFEGFDSEPPEGWSPPRWELRCDDCGRFMSPKHGGSWCHVPYSDVSWGQEHERCRSCTERLGPVQPDQPGLVLSLVCGVYPQEPSDAR